MKKMKENMNNVKDASETLSPAAYAAAVAIVVPSCAGALLAGATLCLALWPVLPVLAYMQRKKELEPTKAALDADPDSGSMEPDVG